MRTACEVATDECQRFKEFAPQWVYPGPARIERYVAPYPLSSDHRRLVELKDGLALYRLTFGQPRQEDMLELLAGAVSNPTRGVSTSYAST